ncbi:MAG TPA: cold shock domain-containing protein [Streptosporangiaceae bacterium]|jgi:cold shock CspA family protein
MPTGKVVRFDEDRGYGFITPDEGGDDVFVHVNEFRERGLHVSTGTRVDFKVIGGGRGLKAYDVQRIDGSASPDVAAVDGQSAGAVLPRSHEVKTAGHADETDENELSEVFSKAELTHLIVDMIMEVTPELTGAQILKLRKRFVDLAEKSGWTY